ncbi:Titin [Aphis craccivora]|uniref:Titin n=1 Tax=Aphis craccivora TaxID=307492 RepID=A0A6G0Z472_APHCR|nr:Titin [Aphis craccivora]
MATAVEKLRVGVGGVRADNDDVRGSGSRVSVVDSDAVADSSRKQRVHHHKRHLSKSSSAVDYAPGNALINELGNPDNMFVTENGTVVTSQIGGTAILPCATVKPGTATASVYCGHDSQNSELNIPA